MEIALGLDNDQDAEQTFRWNFPEAEFISEDIRRVATRELDRVVERCSDHPLWFSACAPCQPFSQQRRGTLASGDERSGVLGELMRFVRRHRPEFVFIENVPGLRRRRIGLDVFEPITEGLIRLGYYLKTGIVRSQDYGVPQRRARLVLLASTVVPVSFPNMTHGPGREFGEFATVRDWISALPPIAAGESHSDVPNHRSARLSPLNMLRISSTPPGGSWRDWPMDLVAPLP